MRTTLIFAALLALLAGCGSASTRDFYFADGTKVYYVSCESNYMIDCYEAAGSLCKAKGYSTVPPLPGMLVVRGMLIKCNS